MKSLNYSSLVLFAVFVFFSLVSCTSSSTNGESNVSYVSLEGTADSALNNQMIYIINPDTHAIEDSTRIENCRFDFGILSSYQDSSLLRLLAADYPVFDTSIRVSLPVVLENASIRAHIGETLGVTGSLLNDRITDFLFQLNVFAEKRHTLSADDFRQMFSLYLTGIISENHDNALGRYLFKTYRDRLDAGSLEKLNSDYGFKP